MPRRIGYHNPHRGEAGRDYERAQSRREDRNFYSSSRWRACRAAFLAANPLCADCPVETLAQCVHHVKERKDRPDLAFDWSNLQALCDRCHNSKRRTS